MIKFYRHKGGFFDDTLFVCIGYQRNFIIKNCFNFCDSPIDQKDADWYVKCGLWEAVSDEEVKNTLPKHLIPFLYEEKSCGLVVVLGGNVEVYSSPEARIEVIDIDNIKAGEGLTELPSGIGFEELVEKAGIKQYVVFTK